MGILLIGGAGFLGSKLANTLHAGGFHVGILDRMDPAQGGAEIERFVGDLRDTHLLRSAISRYPRVLYLVHEAHTAPAADRLPANLLEKWGQCAYSFMGSVCIFFQKCRDMHTDPQSYRPSSSVEPFLETITKSLTQNPVATAKEAAHRIETISGVKLSEDQARRIMKRVGLSYRKTASIPGRADPQMQLVFLQEELIPRLEEAREGKRRVFFVDAAHFVLGAFLGMIWCLTRMFVRTGSGRQRYSVLGAVETRDHDLVSIRTTGTVNSETVCELIEKISATYPSEAITLVMDNARYQLNAKVRDCAAINGIELLFLPAYSPNLNLIERVWRLVKSRTLRNKYFPEFATFRRSIDEFLDSLNDTNRHLLKSLVTENFQTFTIPKL